MLAYGLKSLPHPRSPTQIAYIHSEANGDASLLQDALQDPDLDAQLDSLRAKLMTVREESVDLSRELRALERQSASSDHCTGLVNEVLQLCDENSMHDKFQDMVRAASELRMKMGKLRTRNEDIDHHRTEKIYNPNGDSSTASRGKGFSGLKLEDLQGFLADLENM
ncbi:protein MIS12 homolog [Tripterygium wilfordii]|uniref:protein MIS12 homolog n=1 Tax=Tripterygium wilfordii TaxID=458696 RepID=UPI0018F81602|nr:protein MIS12 homolog [Tripterygium wilfordii]